MKENDNMKEILDQVKSVDGGINNMLIPILKDTISDCNRHNTKLFIIAIIELIIILAIGIFSLFLVYKQNVKYQEFLSQFDFESEDSYTQDLDTGENGDIINPSIKTNK